MILISCLLKGGEEEEEEEGGNKGAVKARENGKTLRRSSPFGGARLTSTSNRN